MPTLYETWRAQDCGHEGGLAPNCLCRAFKTTRPGGSLTDSLYTRVGSLWSFDLTVHQKR